MYDDLNSELDYSSEVERKKKLRAESFAKPQQEAHTSKVTRDYFFEECAKEATKRQNVLHLDVYSRHKRLINQYFLTNPSAATILKRDDSRDKTDLDVIRENSKFLWNEEDQADSWEKNLAKKYYDKLYKEYCVGDLSHYKENKVGLRWRIEKEVIDGKGQFVCGEKRCSEVENLTSWECKFNYVEHGEHRTALVKLRLCPSCSDKLNYRHRKNEAKAKKRTAKKRKRSSSQSGNEGNSDSSASNDDDDIIDELLL